MTLVVATFRRDLISRVFGQRLEGASTSTSFKGEVIQEIEKG